MPKTRPWGDPSLLRATLLALVVSAAMAVLARGMAGDEEPGHYLLARYAPTQPELFLRIAGRPLITVALSLPSQLGFHAARLSAALATAAGALAVARLALTLGALSPLWLVAYLFVQPFFIAHAGTAMTEPWAAALMAWGLLAVVERRWRLLAVVAALLPLARMETLVMWPLVLGLLIHGRAWPHIAVLPVPLLIWNLLGALSSGDALWLLHQSNWRAYPERASLHYVQSFVWIVGLGLFVPVVVGLLETLAPFGEGKKEIKSSRHRAHLAAAVVLLVFLVVYTALAVWHPITFGNLRYFAYAAPALAVLGAAGTRSLMGPRSLRGWIQIALAGAGAAFLWNHPLVGDFGILHRLDLLPLAVALLWALLYAQPVRVRALAPLLVLLLGGFGLARNHTGTLHLRPTPEHAAVREAADLLVNPLPDHATLYSAHAVLAFYRGTNPYDRTTSPAVTDRTTKMARPGSVLLWETHYALRTGPSLELRAFLKDPTWRYLGGVVSSDSIWAGGFFERWTDTAPDSGSPPPPSPRLVSGGLDESTWRSTALLVQAGVPLARREVRLDPGNTDLWRNLALNLSVAGLREEAWSALSEAERLDPRDPYNPAFQAELLRHQGNHEGSLAAARRALALDPNNGELHYQVGRTLLHLKRPQEARSHLLEAARRLSKRWDVQYSAGAALYREQNWAEAEPFFLATLRLRPSHTRAVIRSAEIAVRLGRQEQALTRLRDFIGRNPSVALPYTVLGDLLTKLGRPGEARRVWQEGLEKTGGDPEIASRLESSTP